MGALDLARSDWQAGLRGLEIVQVPGACAQVAMAGAHGCFLVSHTDVLAMRRQSLEHRREPPLLEGLLLRLHPGLAGGGLGLQGFGGGAQVLADVVEVDQVAPLFPEPLFDLPDWLCY